MALGVSSRPTPVTAGVAGLEGERVQTVRVDQSDIVSLRAITDPEPVTDFDTGEVVVNKTGERTWRTGVAVRQDGQRRPSVIEIKTRSVTPPQIAEGDPVTVTGLVATFWEQNGRAGLAFRAESINRADGSASVAPTGPGASSMPTTPSATPAPGAASRGAGKAGGSA